MSTQEMGLREKLQDLISFVISSEQLLSEVQLEIGFSRLLNDAWDSLRNASRFIYAFCNEMGKSEKKKGDGMPKFKE